MDGHSGPKSMYPFTALLALTVANGQVIDAAAPIETVTIYGQGARITRVVRPTLAGAATLRLPPLPADVDPRSIQLRPGSKGAEVQSLRIVKRGLDDFPFDRIKDAMAALDQVESEIELAQRELTLVETLGRVTKWTVATPDQDGDPSTPLRKAPGALARTSAWRAALAFLDDYGLKMARRAEAVAERLDNLRDSRRERFANARTLSQTGSEGRLQVISNVKAAGPSTFHLTYAVEQAHWRPAYEVGLDTRTGKVTIRLLGLVAHQTGESWPAVPIVLSTAVPTAAAAPPALAAWRLGQGTTFIPQWPQRASVAAPAARKQSQIVADSNQAALLRRLMGRVGDVLESSEPPEPELPKSNETLPDASQGRGAGIVGYVFDSAGQPLMGVKIQVAAGDGRLWTVYSGKEGRFALDSLGPGIFSVTAGAPNLRSVRQEGVRLEADTQAEINLVMEIEGDVQEVRVMEQAPLVNTSRPEVREELQGSWPGGILLPASRPSSRSPTGSVSLVPSQDPLAGANRLPVWAAGLELSFPVTAVEAVESGQPEQRLPLKTWSWPVKLKHAAYPGRREEALVEAVLTSAAKEALPGGRATLLVDGGLAGEADLPRVAPGQKISLPVGADPAVRPVRRVTVETRESGVFRRWVTHRYTVTIDVANPHKRPLSLAVYDQIPVATDRTVEVALVEPGDADVFRRETGALSWNLRLPPGKQARIRFVYNLKRPKDHTLYQQEIGP